MPVGTFLLFAGREPNRGDDGRGILREFPRMRAFAIFPPGSSEKESVARAKQGPHPWEFPIDVRPCLELVLDLARKAGQTVKLVDVNRPEDDRELVGRFVDESHVLPMLVAPSGARLEGLDAFSPAAVRSFLGRG